MGQLRTPDGRVYQTGSKPVTAADAAEAREKAALARVGAAVMKEAAKRLEVIKALEDAASRWTAAAMAEPSSMSELRRYWLSKAASARARAQELREESK